MKKPLLEKIVGTEKVEKFKDSPAYKYAVDTAAMISFSTPIAMANEIFVAGMDVKDSLKARGIATIVNMNCGLKPAYEIGGQNGA